MRGNPKFLKIEGPNTKKPKSPTQNELGFRRFDAQTSPPSDSIYIQHGIAETKKPIETHSR